MNCKENPKQLSQQTMIREANIYIHGFSIHFEMKTKRLCVLRAIQ